MAYMEISQHPEKVPGLKKSTLKTYYAAMALNIFGKI